MAITWFYEKDGTQHGPISSNELKQLAANGDLEPKDLVWREGTSKWRQADSVKGLLFYARSTKTPVVDLGEDPTVPDAKEIVQEADTIVNEWFDEPHLGEEVERSTFSSSIQADVKTPILRTRPQPSAKRYPNLIRYIRISDAVILSTFWISVIGGIAAFVFFVLDRLRSIEGDTVAPNLLVIVVAFIATGSWIGLCWLWMVACLAFTELLQVCIDTESNTRNVEIPTSPQ